MGYCGWNSASEIDRHYHDTEWGIPVHDDRKQFEYLMMEVMQCGLSWELMLRKREIFRQCFDNFDFDKVAAYDERDVERIMNTEGMIRSPRKIRAIINNARCFQKSAIYTAVFQIIYGPTLTENHYLFQSRRRTHPRKQRLVGKNQQGLEKQRL